MSWNTDKKRVHNYADGLNGNIALPQKDIHKIRRTRCECGKWVQAFRIVDTSDLPAEVTQGQQWACDNCWISWIRHDPRHQREHLGRPFRLLDWFELHGAPAVNIARQISRDSRIHKIFAVKRQQIVDRPDSRGQIDENDEGRIKELARIDDNLNRIIDKSRSPVL